MDAKIAAVLRATADAKESGRNGQGGCVAAAVQGVGLPLLASVPEISLSKHSTCALLMKALDVCMDS